MCGNFRKTQKPENSKTSGLEGAIGRMSYFVLP